MITKLKKLYDVTACRKMSRRQLTDFRDHRLRQVIEHAYKTSPFYKALMDRHSVRPDHIKTASELSLIPTTNKTDIQKHYRNVISNRFTESECYVRSTSGSSGKMLRVLWEKDSFWNRLCMYYRTLNMIGYTPLKKLLYFLPVPEKTGFTFGLFRQLGLEPGTSFPEIRSHLMKFRPDIMAIYPSYAVDLGRYLSKRDIKAIGIEAISLNSEMILPHDRAEIERVFECPTYDEYSSVEMGFISSMCKQRNNHVFSDNVVMEILRADGTPADPGERGEIVLTSLTNYAMPFIRYRIGDISYLKEERTCRCGLPFPVIGPVEGRKDDAFVCENGSTIPAWKLYEAVERPLEDYGMEKLVLSDFYFVQKDRKNARFYYVKGPDFDDGYLDEFRKKIDTLLGHGLTVEIEETDNIGRVKTVKRKYIHCEC